VTLSHVHSLCLKRLLLLWVTCVAAGVPGLGVWGVGLSGVGGIIAAWLLGGNHSVRVWRLVGVAGVVVAVA
jgi:hypothetical protein